MWHPGATAADRDAALEEERATRTASRGVGAGRGAGARGRPARPQPAVEHWSDEEEDDDWETAQLASRWQRSKREQAEREAERAEAEAELKAARAAAEAAEAAERARRNSGDEKRAGPTPSDARVRAAQCDADWEAFTKLGEKARIRYADVPWPALDAATLGMDARYAGARERKAAYRAASLRWHPDKFVQSFGSRLVPEEREKILKRVTEVAQAVNSIYQEVKDSN